MKNGMSHSGWIKRLRWQMIGAVLLGVVAVVVPLPDRLNSREGYP